VPPGADLLCVLYACIMAGLPVALLDPEMGRDNYLHKLAQLKPAWAFVDYRLLLLREHPIVRLLYFQLRKKGPYFPWLAGCRVVGVGRWLPVFAKHHRYAKLLKNGAALPDAVLQVHSPTAPLLIIYTSGTVSEPKGVVHTAASVTASIGALLGMLRGQQHRAMATHLPHFLLIGVSAGIPVHLWGYPLPAQEQLRFIQQHEISTLFGPPSDFMPLLDYCKKRGDKLPAVLRHLFFGSAPVRRAFLERLAPVLPEGCSVTCLYGMTEHLMAAHCDGAGKLAADIEGDLLGQPFEGVQFRIAADGEVEIQSGQLFQQYLGQPVQVGFFKTGDMGRLDGQGRLVLTGRKKDMIIRRNFNLYPGLYEPTIHRIPGVVDCAMVGFWSEAKQDEEVVLVLEVELHFAKEKLDGQLRHGQFSIDAEALPDRIVFMPLPRSGRQQKVDRRALRAALCKQFAL
jgi:acyl-CoA synthetase (AMP-forming)/AMP-acid ligase II